jgi:hypothetical protein
MLFFIFILVFSLLLLAPFIIVFFLYFFRRNSKLKISLNKVFLINCIESGKEKKTIIFEVLLKNEGLFHTIILDIIPYLNPPSLNYFKLSINNFSNTYFDTLILKKDKEHKVYFVFILKDFYNFDIQDLKNFYLSLNILYYDLKPIRNLYKEFSLKDFNKIDTNLPKELENIFKSFYYQEKEKLEIIDKSNEKMKIYCLKTPIITHFETEEYLINLITEGIKLLKSRNNGLNNNKVLISIAESLVAIIQKRAFNVFSIETNFISELFNHYFNEDSSLSSSYALTKVIQEIGFIRFYIGIIAGIIGKFLKKSGWFYVIAGRKAAAVDDAGGTIRPYDKYVVLAPDNPKDWAINFKNKLISKLVENGIKDIQIDIFVVDANDLGKVDILGSSNKELNNFVITNLRSNPQGNDDQQTPIVFLSN